jgi:hypothetical protein
MAHITRLWTGMRTWDIEDAGTPNPIVLIIHDNGQDDLLHHTLPPKNSPQSDLKRGRSNLYEVVLASPIDIFQGQGGFQPGNLQPSSIRVGIRGGDAWQPEDIFVFGASGDAPVPLALARRITKKLSTQQKDDPNDPFGARISIPIPPVTVGHHEADIVGLIVLMLTGADGLKTGDSVELRIKKQGPPGQAPTDSLVDFDMPASAVASSAPDSAQGEQFHQKRNEASFYYVGGHDFLQPSFKKTDLDPGAQAGSITLQVQGDGSWQPASFFIFGIGREPEVHGALIPLAHIPDWGQSGMGTLKGGKSPTPLSVAQDPPLS